MHCGVTPSDASHVLNRVDAWDKAAAEKSIGIVCPDNALALVKY
jgi:hypothetical protein